MKKFIAFFIIIISSHNFTQAQDSSYVINGQFEKIQSGTIFLNIYENSKTIRDSAAVNNGSFTFKGYISSPSFATLTMPARQDDYFTFYVEPVTMAISGRGDSLKLLTVKGSPLNDDNKLLAERMKYITEWENTNSKIYEQAYKAKNMNVMDSLDAIDDSILLAKRKVVAAFVKAYPNSLRAAMAILSNYSYYAEAGDVQPLYDELSPSIKNSAKGKDIKKMIDSYNNVAIGRQAPEISQSDTSGNSIALSSLHGKYVLVDFWASWCGPCRRENPNVVKAYDQFKDKGFTIYSVSYDTKKDKWEKAIKDDKLNWYQVSELKGWMNSTSNEYGIKAIPSNLLLDKDGKIVAKNLFGQKLVEELTMLTGK